MNAHICHGYECSICGGELIVTPSSALHAWYGGELVHYYPSVCRDNLARQREAIVSKQLVIPSETKTTRNEP